MRKNVEEFSEGKSQQNGPLAEQKKTTQQDTTGVGRRTRRKIKTWNQIIARDSRQKEDISHLRAPFGASKKGSVQE